MANIVENVGIQVFDVLVPPMFMMRLPFRPVFDLEFVQLRRQVHQRYCNDLGLPLQT